MQQTDYMMSKTAVSIADNTGSAKAVFYLSNHRGDSMLVATYRYDAFGNQRTGYCVISDPANAPRYTFSTKEYLSDAKLYLYQYRVYDPQAGRWTQRDPIDYQDSINLYQFCGNTPVNAVDPSGLDTYRQNRQLNPKAVSTREPREHPVTHTFIYTTDKDGNLEHTYSWGYTYDKHGNGNWVKDAPEDRDAAQKAIDQRRDYEKAPFWKKPFMKDNFDPRVGGEELDSAVDSKYEKRAALNGVKHPSRHSNYLLWNNCKTEAKRLIRDAKNTVDKTTE